MKFIFIVFLTISTLAIISCKKEGCTDSEAYIYNEDAKKDDGSCTYVSTTTFWFKKALSDSLTALGANFVEIKLGGVPASISQTTIATSQYLNSEPNCGDDYPQMVTKYTFLGKNKEQFEYLEINCYPSANNGNPLTIVEKYYLHKPGCSNYEIKF